MNKLAFCLLAGMLLVSGLTAIQNTPLVRASETIYIRSDGTIDPPSAPIQQNGATYTFTDDILNQSIVIQMGGITLDGAGHKIESIGSGIGITIQAASVEIRNLQITRLYCGIDVEGDGNHKISNCTITYAVIGITVGEVLASIEVQGCQFSNDVFGVRMSGVTGSTFGIKNNVFTNASISLSAWGGMWVGTITGNLVEHSGKLVLGDCSSVLRNNTLISTGLDVEGTMTEHYMHDIDTSNTIDGKPIYFLIGHDNERVPSNAAYIALTNCRNMIVENLTITENGQGIVLANTIDSKIRNVNIVNCDVGIVFIEASNNKVYDCNVTHYWFPFYADTSGTNYIFHNNFVDHCYSPPYPVESTSTVLDLGYPSGGNYWSDYNGTDLYSGPYQNETGSDGIGDTPYVFDATNVDHYPLFLCEGHVSILADTNNDGTVNIQDVVLIAMAYGSHLGELHWNPWADITQPYGKIDLFDLVTCTAHYGETTP